MATPTVGSPGDNKAFLDGTAVALPVVVDGSHNQFAFDSQEYVVASGTYRALDTLIVALNAAAQVGDSSRLDTHLKASKSPFTDGALRFTAAAAGVNTHTMATGASNSVLSRLSVSNGTALARGATPISTGRSFASTLTTDQTPPTAARVAGNASPLSWAAVPTLQASWANKTGYQAAQFSKSPEGLVRLRGVIEGGTKTAGTTIFTLAAGYRPAAKCVFQVSPEVDATSNNAGEIVIDTDGTVKVGGTTLTASSYITLAGVVFDTAS